MNMKPLIFVPSPRDLPVFEEAIDKLKFDKLLVKYYPEIVAYTIGSSWFLNHKEYSHFVVLPDDLIVTETDLNHLLYGDIAYCDDVISGWCRNTVRLKDDWKGPPETEETAASNISFILPPNPPISGTYEQYNFISLRYIGDSKDNIIQVKHSGFGPMIIPRQVIERIPFRSSGCCVDSHFALDLDSEGIPQYCDLRVRTTHINSSDPEKLLTGKKEPTIIFESATANYSAGLFNVP